MDPGKKKSSRKGTREEGLKDPIISCPEHVRPAFVGLVRYRSLVDQEDLTLVCVRYCIPGNYEIELPRLDA